jgi:hypothetical protein
MKEKSATAKARVEGPWTREEAAVLDALRTPFEIQSFLDSLPYSPESRYRCPRSVLRDKRAHCFDGAVFAAAALQRIGFRALLVDLRAVRDDDHVVALYGRAGHLGSVAKSNVVGLRFREAIHRTLRELALTYFHAYFNVDGEMTLRSYSRPVDLDRIGAPDWTTRDRAMDLIAERLNSVRHYTLLSRGAARALSPVDSRSFEGGMLGADQAGLYRPKKNRG